MTTIRDIKQALEEVTHASQNKAVLGMLLGYLQEAGVRTPAEREQEQQVYREIQHQRVAQAMTVAELSALTDEWDAAGELDDEALVKALNERGALLHAQEETKEEPPAEIETGDYSAWGRPKLVKQAGLRGLPAGGTREELAERLVQDDERRKAEADWAASQQ